MTVSLIEAVTELEEMANKWAGALGESTEETREWVKFAAEQIRRNLRNGSARIVQVQRYVLEKPKSRRKKVEAKELGFNDPQPPPPRGASSFPG